MLDDYTLKVKAQIYLWFIWNDITALIMQNKESQQNNPITDTMDQAQNCLYVYMISQKHYLTYNTLQ